jgi:hypothetical protein
VAVVASDGRGKRLFFVVGLVCLCVLVGVVAFMYGYSSNDMRLPVSNLSFPEIQGYNLSFSYRDFAYQETSGNDAALVYSYRPFPQNVSEPTVFVALQIGNGLALQHHWEDCLINYPLSQGNQSTVVQLDLKDIQLQDSPPVTGRFFAFQYKETNITQVVLYWYRTATFSVNGLAQTKNMMLSLVMYPQSTDAKVIADCEATELPIARAIIDYWQPQRAWSMPP